MSELTLILYSHMAIGPGPGPWKTTLKSTQFITFTHSSFNLKDSAFFCPGVRGPEESRRTKREQCNYHVIRHQTSGIIRHRTSDIKNYQTSDIRLWSGSVRGRVEPGCPLPLPHHRQQDQQGPRHPQCGGQEA